MTDPGDRGSSGLLEESAEDLYEHAPCGYLSTHPDGTVLRVNATFLEWTGYARDELVGRRRFADLLTGGGRIYHETHLAPLLGMQGFVREISLELRRADGSRLPVLVNATLRRDDGGAPQLVRITVFDATDRQAYERELLIARRREQAARERTERLQLTTAALAAAADPDEVAEAVAEHLSKVLGAEDVELALLDEDGRPPELAALLDEAGDAPLAVRGAVAADGARQTLAVLPLSAPGRRAQGAILARIAGARELDADERVFALACVGQCAQAIERLRLYAETAAAERRFREIAHTLQRSLLTTDFPPDPRYAVVTRYRPGVETLEVGGDFFDAFLVDEGILGTVVGDVVGRGIEAATAMGRLRSGIRALATGGLGPARVLERLDGFVEPLPEARMATIAYAELDLSSGALRYACAGHPPPVVVQPGAEAVLLWEGRSAPLGAYGDSHERREAEVELEPGARLLLYTDGLVERRNERPTAGFERLSAELGARRERPLAACVDEVLERMLEGGPGDDDVCVLGLERTATSEEATR